MVHGTSKKFLSQVNPDEENIIDQFKQDQKAALKALRQEQKNARVELKDQREKEVEDQHDALTIQSETTTSDRR